MSFLLSWDSIGELNEVISTPSHFWWADLRREWKRNQLGVISYLKWIKIVTGKLPERVTGERTGKHPGH